MPAPRTDDPIRILIVEEHDLFRTGLALMLGSEPDLEVVGQASGGQMGLRLALELRPDIVVTDLRMPDMDGIALIRKISTQLSHVQLVVLTVAADDEDITAALGAGACAYLGKDSPAHEIAAAIRAAATGSAWLSPRAAESVLGRIRYLNTGLEPSGALNQLSAREYDVLRLVAQGLDNTEIAETLDISPNTAKNHVSSVLAKLGLPNRTQAAIYAIRSELGRPSGDSTFPAD
jgi:NarL family two-component system response regulator LiaR